MVEVDDSFLQIRGDFLVVFLQFYQNRMTLKFQCCDILSETKNSMT